MRVWKGGDGPPFHRIDIYFDMAFFIASLTIMSGLPSHAVATFSAIISLSADPDDVEPVLSSDDMLPDDDPDPFDDALLELPELIVSEEPELPDSPELIDPEELELPELMPLCILVKACACALVSIAV